MLPKLGIIGTENIFKHLYKPVKFDVDNTCSAFDRLDIKITCMNRVCFYLYNNVFSVH